MRKEIQIKDCSIDGAWYQNEINQTFTIIGEIRNEFVVVDSKGDTRTVKKHDATILKKEEE